MLLVMYCLPEYTRDLLYEGCHVYQIQNKVLTPKTALFRLINHKAELSRIATESTDSPVVCLAANEQRVKLPICKPHNA